MIILLKIGWETGCETQSKENVEKLICVFMKEYIYIYIYIGGNHQSVYRF